MTNAYQSLRRLLECREGPLYIALSGGIDSLTLMAVAASVRTQPTIAMHAVSAAVPAEATERCRTLAEKSGWQLREIDALEFEDSNYVNNPHNRCYYCKNSLFNAIEVCKEISGVATIATGTNTDDLGDFRPGLEAASEHNVWQPYVEAGVSKETIREIARLEGLGTLSELPAAPCLSSRVETGISINANDLSLIYQVEKLLTRMTEPGDIRCRIFKRGVTVQLPSDSAIFKQTPLRSDANAQVDALCQAAGKTFTGFEKYVKGSAFIKTVQVQRAGC
jgi:uncharacterized protein